MVRPAAADEQLQEQGVLLAASRGGPAALTATEAADRSRALDAIDDDAFVPAAFSSSRHKVRHLGATAASKFYQLPR